MNQVRADLGALRKGEIIGGLIYLPMFLIGSQIIAAVIARLMGMDLKADSTLGYVSLIYGCLNALALAAIFHRYLADQFRRLTARGWAIFADLLLGFLMCYGLLIVASILVSYLSALFQVEYFNANQEAAESAIRMSPLATILYACVLAPFGEEVMFRGLIFCGLYRKSRFWAYAVSMLSFSMLHIYEAAFSQPIGVTLINILVYLPYGFALARTYERSRSIWVAVFLHAAINVAAILLQHLVY